MRPAEAKIAFDEWASVALKRGGANPPAGVCGQIQSEIPDGSSWALAADARAFWALGPDGVLRTLTLDADGQVSSTSLPLAGRRITVSHTTSLAEPYQDSETHQRHHWRFSVDGTPLLELTGTVYGELGRPRDRPDRPQMLAFALQELAGRTTP